MKFYVFVCFFALIVLASSAKVKPSLCSLPHSADGYVEPVVWRCHGQLPLWSYDKDRDQCVQFRYGGCGGNDNSFFTKEDCEAMCKS